MYNANNKMVLFVSPLPPPAGGIATWTKKIVDYGLPNGYDVQIVDTSLTSRLIFDKIKISRKEVIRNIRIVLSFVSKIIIDRPVIIHLNCSLSATGVFRESICHFIANIMRIPVVTQYRGNVNDFPIAAYRGSSLRALKSIIKQSTANVVLNKSSLEFIEEISMGCKIEPLIIPNFIEDNFFNINKRDKVDESKTVATFVGGISKAKGCSEIIKVAKLLLDVEFRLIGTVQEDIHAELGDLSKNVVIKGPLDHLSVIDELCNSDIFLFPSHTEGFPNSVLEAMSIGLPVVATKVGAIPEMIDIGEGGILVEIDDIDGIKNAIQTFLEDRALMRQMGNYNKSKSQSLYRYSVITKKLTDLYDRVVQTYYKG